MEELDRRFGICALEVIVGVTAFLGSIGAVKYSREYLITVGCTAIILAEYQAYKIYKLEDMEWKKKTQD